MAHPLPAARSFFPDTQAGRWLRRQSLEIDCFLRRNHIGNYDVVAVHGRFEIAQRYLPDVQTFDQRYFAGPTSRSVRMDRLKTFGDFTFQFFALMSSHICFSSFSPSLVVEFIVHESY